MPFVALSPTANCDDILARPSNGNPTDADVYAALAIGDAREAISTSHFVMRTGCLYTFNGIFHSDPGLVDLTSNSLQIDGSQSPYVSDQNVAAIDRTGEAPDPQLVSRAISFGLGTSQFRAEASLHSYQPGQDGRSASVNTIGCSAPFQAGGAGYTLAPSYFSGTVSEYASTTPTSALFRSRAYGLNPLERASTAADQICLRTPIPYLSSIDIGVKEGRAFRMILGGYQAIADLPLLYRCWTQGLRMPKIASGPISRIADLQTIDACHVTDESIVYYQRQYISDYDIMDVTAQRPGGSPVYAIPQAGVGVERTFLSTLTNTKPTAAPLVPFYLATSGNECYLQPYRASDLPESAPEDHASCSQIVFRGCQSYDSSTLVLFTDYMG